jgi:hypothetical protein
MTSCLDKNHGFPGPRQQRVEAVDGISIDHSGEHVSEIGVGFDAVQFAGFDQRAEDCPTIATTVTAGEQVVLAAERYGTDRALNRIGVELDTAVVQEARQTCREARQSATPKILLQQNRSKGDLDPAGVANPFATHKRTSP